MERRFQLLPAAVQVSLGEGDAPAEIVPVLFEAAALARDNGLHRLLVVSGFGDPTDAESVSRAMEHLHGVAASQPLRIAFVAYTLDRYAAYHFAERYAQRFGIEVKVHVSTLDAQRWLELGSSSKRGPAQGAPATAGSTTA